MVAVDRKYVEVYGIENATLQAHNAFLNDLDSTRSFKNYTVDPEFIRAANFTPVRNFGGDYLFGPDGLVQWVSSIQDLRKDMVCLEWESTPVTHFYSMDNRTKARQEEMENAIRVALAAPECNHLDFSFKKPERAIMKVFDAYACEKRVKGSWWLVKGPDRMGNCLLSWSYLDPHKQRSSIGWT